MAWGVSTGYATTCSQIEQREQSQWWREKSQTARGYHWPEIHRLFIRRWVVSKQTWQVPNTVPIHVT